MSKKEKSSKKPATEEPEEKIPVTKPTRNPTPPLERTPRHNALIAAAEDINATLSPKPLLDITLEEEPLAKELTEMIPDLQKDDNLSLKTWKTLKELTPKAAKEPKAAKVSTKLSRKSAVYTVIREKGASKAGIDAKELETLSTKLMVEKNGQAGTSASNICNNTLDALVEFKVMTRAEDGKCRLNK